MPHVNRYVPLLWRPSTPGPSPAVATPTHKTDGPFQPIPLSNENESRGAKKGRPQTDLR